MTEPRGMGWRPDPPDFRDFLFSADHDLLAKGLPDVQDLRPQCPPVRNQGPLGSCTGFSSTGAMEFERLKQALPDFEPSELFVYYVTRAKEGTTASDAGATIRDTMKTLAKVGAPPETDWPYDPTQFAVKPPDQAYTDAKLDLALKYQRVSRSLPQMLGCLAAGYPFVLGFTVYQSFESDAVASSGLMPMPSTGESVLGGHAVLAVGYRQADQRVIVRNSWGPGWGDSGYFYMPFAYLLDPNLAGDMWTVRAVGMASI